ncbi:MAG: TonB-dependent receptor [Bacteroidales bacterium]|nr:TonB-dependent receptor [Bacteroidales bacterium]
MKQFFTFIFFSAVGLSLFGQTLKGFVYDKKTEETLVGVNVYYKERDNVVGVATDAKGYYELTLPDGGAIVNYGYIGYEAEAHPVVIRKGQEQRLDVYLPLKEELMKEVVVSAGRFEQELSEITVSMDVLKPVDLIKQNPKDLSVVLNTLPGVDVVDQQISIRGGGGWTYGVGSRSLVLVDGMSILSPSVSDINWNLIPLQNVAQVEVLKGASSVLYGSSALNGLVNIRTERPGLEPQTRVNTYMGTYLKPKTKSYVWWDEEFWHDDKFKVTPMLRRNVLYGIRNPIYTGTDFSHSRRIGNFDVSLGGDMYTNEGYRQDDFTQRVRIGGNVTYHDKKIKGMNYGLNGNLLFNNYSGFFIWESAEHAYNQSPLTNMSRQGNMVYIDPFFNYVNPRNNTSHHVKARYFHKSERLVSNPTDESLLEIVSRIGLDTDKISELMPDVLALLQLSPDEMLPALMPYLAPYLPYIVSQDYAGLITEIAKNGKEYFPNASAPDLVKLISWVMGHSPFPSNGQEALAWIANLDKPATKSDPPDNTNSYFLDYQFNKQLGFAQFTTGVTYNRLTTSSQMTGYHESDNIAAFFQYDQKFFRKLNVSAGVRLEYYRVDSLLKEATTDVFNRELPFKPVFRGGLNYELAEHTFIRGSFGQGYRYPSITEKFVYKDIGGMGAYPNKNLKAEEGYNAEIGIKQGYKVGNFSGFLDLAGFYTMYKNMIEFEFGLFNSATLEKIADLSEVLDMIQKGQIPALGTRFSNVDKARIYGLDASVNGIWKISPASNVSYNVGYVYIEPIDVNWKEKADIEAAKGELEMKEKSNDSKYLKYRQKHTVKGVFDFQWNRWSVGTNLMYKSKTLAVDYFIVDEREKEEDDMMDIVRSLIFPGLHDYWEEHNTGSFTMDARFGVKINKNIQSWLMLSNLLNTESSLRPMDVSAPRTFIVQLNFKF